MTVRKPSEAELVDAREWALCEAASSTDVSDSLMNPIALALLYLLERERLLGAVVDELRPTGGGAPEGYGADAWDALDALEAFDAAASREDRQ